MGLADAEAAVEIGAGATLGRRRGAAEPAPPELRAGLDPIPWLGDVVIRVSGTAGSSTLFAAHLVVALPFPALGVAVAWKAAVDHTGGPSCLIFSRQNLKHMNRTADGQGALQQAQEDRERLLTITTFLTLQGLKGPGVTFEYLGETNPSGSYARQEGGSWAKLVRKAPGRPNITFWLAHVADAQGLMRATYPGVVRVDGEPQNNIPTEDYILQDWADRPSDPPRPLRFPRKILAFQIRPDQPPLNFLRAAVAHIEIDAAIHPPPYAPPAQPARR